MMVRQSMGLPGQYKMPLDPDYESDYDSDDDEDENPKDPYVSTCFCCCNLGIGVILGALFFLVSQIIFCSLAPSSGQISNNLRWIETEPSTRIENPKTNHTMGDRDLVMTHIGSDLGGSRRSRREISREIIIAVMKRKKIFSTYQE